MLSGCDLSEPFDAPLFPFLNGFNSADAGAPVLADNANWWHGLEDPVLDQLVVLSLRDSLNIAAARERVVAAQLTRQAIPGAAVLSPTAQVLASGTSPQDTITSGNAEIGLDWMLDPYGTRRDQMRVAGAQVELAEAEADAAQLLLLYNMANAYVELRYRQRIIALSRQELASRRETLNLTRTLARAEAATRLEITRSEARVAEIRSQIPAQEAAVEAKLNEIAVLAGATPGTLPTELAALLNATAGQPVPSLSPDVGIPADLLRNRPDIRIAERRYYMATAEIGIARAALYPRLSLSGAISVNVVGASPASADYFFGPVVQFPSLPTSATNAGIELRHSQARQAHLAWQTIVLDAILEVENALVEYQSTNTATRSSAEAVRLYSDVLYLTRQVFRREEATLGELVSAEQAVLNAKQALARLRLDHAQRFVALNVSLGTGGNPAVRVSQQVPISAPAAQTPPG